MSCRFGLGIVLVMLMLLGAGCVSSTSNRSTSGKYVDEKSFSQVTPGVTKASWLKSVLGDPTEIKKTSDGTDIWKWSYEERRESHGQVLIISDRTNKATSVTASVEIKDGVVINKWYSGQCVKDDHSVN
jgi:outer membrane protein assembly factor BamE (lipoprotein component of BamABCDE complex)